MHALVKRGFLFVESLNFGLTDLRPNRSAQMHKPTLSRTMNAWRTFNSCISSLAQHQARSRFMIEGLARIFGNISARASGSSHAC